MSERLEKFIVDYIKEGHNDNTVCHTTSCCFIMVQLEEDFSEIGIPKLYEILKNVQDDNTKRGKIIITNARILMF